MAKRIGVLSEDVKMYVYLQTAKRYYALNGRTINLLMKGKLYMGATNGGDETDNPMKFSDVEAAGTVHTEKEIEMFIVDKNKQEQVAHSSHILISLYLVYLNVVFLNLLVNIIISIIVYILLYRQAVYLILNYRS